MFLRKIILPLTFACVHLHSVDTSKLSLEEKVGQLFMVYFDGSVVNDQAKKLIQDAKIGGVILYPSSNGLHSPKDVLNLCNELQESSLEEGSLPLLIAIDQEGGAITRLERGVTDFSGNKALGMIDDLSYAKKSSKIIAEELRAVGINFNLAPVVDVNINPNNPIIGIRSFGDNPKKVADLGEAVLDGLEEGGIVSCLKHFPGHGDVTVDSHEELPVVKKDYFTIEKCELYPFERMAKKAHSIMTAHILFPALDPSCCATLSERIIHGLLREKWNFDGVVITDSLMMKGVKNNEASTDDVILKSFKAGNDILLIGGRDLFHQVTSDQHVDEVIHYYHVILDAVKKGEISESRLDESVKRIITLKEKAKLFQNPFADPNNLKSKLRTPESVALSKEIAYRVFAASGTIPPSTINGQKILMLCPEQVELALQSSGLERISKKTDLITFNPTAFSPKEMDEMIQKAKGYDYMIFCSYNAWRFQDQITLLKELLNLKKPVIAIATRDDKDLELFDGAYVKIATNSPTRSAFEVVKEYILDEMQPLDIELDQAKLVGEKIWKNECNGRVDQLTFWNQNEPFPSMGIGHFIWPPKGYRGVFEEGKFHEVISYVHENGASLPDWLLNAKYCPWENRDQFYRSMESIEMRELKKFLIDTIPYQAKYLVKQVNRAYMAMIHSIPLKKQPEFISAFYQVAKTSFGPYVLMDYINFKGDGTDVKQRYNGMGWGLLQVLELFSSIEADSVEEKFFLAAKKVLERRVENAPEPEREKKWLIGWINRLKTYRL